MNKKSVTIYVVSILLIISFAGCDFLSTENSERYKVGKTKRKDLLVIDKKTGKLKVMNNGVLTKVPNEKDINRLKSYSAKNLATHPIVIDDIQLKFRNGQCLYKGNLHPTVDEYKKAGDYAKNSTKEEIIRQGMPENVYKKLEEIWTSAEDESQKTIYIETVDKDDFVIETFEITRNKCTKTVNSKGNVVQLSFNGKKPLDYNEFQAITGLSFKWYLSDWSSE